MNQLLTAFLILAILATILIIIAACGVIVCCFVNRVIPDNKSKVEDPISPEDQKRYKEMWG